MTSRAILNLSSLFYISTCCNPTIALLHCTQGRAHASASSKEGSDFDCATQTLVFFLAPM